MALVQQFAVLAMAWAALPELPHVPAVVCPVDSCELAVSWGLFMPATASLSYCCCCLAASSPVLPVQQCAHNPVEVWELLGCVGCMRSIRNKHLKLFMETRDVLVAGHTVLSMLCESDMCLRHHRCQGGVPVWCSTTGAAPGPGWLRAGRPGVGMCSCGLFIWGLPSWGSNGPNYADKRGL